MTPIHQLLSRIRWDAEFGRGQFTIGYLDKVAGRIQYVAFQDAQPDPDNHALLDIVDDEGVEISIPLHRIRQVLRNGEVIWQRGSLDSVGAESDETE
jgi:uncharacterized protein (UPF0248 family)